MGDIDADNLRKQISTLTQLIEIDEKIDNLDDIVFELVCRCIEIKIETDNATIIAACIYQAAKTDEGRLISLDEIAKLSKINRKQIGRAYRLIVRELKLPIGNQFQDPASEIKNLVRRNILQILGYKMHDEITNRVETFIDDHIDLICEVRELNSGYMITVVVLGSNEKFTVQEIQETIWFPYQGPAREYLREHSLKFGEEEETDERRESFSNEKLTQLFHQDEEFTKALQLNNEAYDLLKNGISSKI